MNIMTNLEQKVREISVITDQVNKYYYTVIAAIAKHKYEYTLDCKNYRDEIRREYSEWEELQTFEKNLKNHVSGYGKRILGSIMTDVKRIAVSFRTDMIKLINELESSIDLYDFNEDDEAMIGITNNHQKRLVSILKRRTNPFVNNTNKAIKSQ